MSGLGFLNENQLDALLGSGGSASTLTTPRDFSIQFSGITAAPVSFDGSANVVLTASVDSGHITLARMANMATASLIYRKTAGTGVPEVNTLATLKTDLGLTGTNSGDQTITLTGDVTGSGTGSFATTLATVNANTGAWGSATQAPVITLDGKGRATAASNVTITPAASSITGGAALTKVDDTNVTLTLGGTPTTALLAASSLTLGWTGTLGVARGGTNIASYAVGDLIYASGTTTLAKLAGVATGNVLISGGVTTAPSWGKIGLTTHVSAITASRALVSDGSGFVSAATTTATEIGYVNGVTSAIQTQINGKQATITFGTGVQTALGFNIGSAGAPVVNGGALGTPSSGTATNLTGLPISTGVSGLGTGVATFLATPSSANLAAALTDETGTGAAVFAGSPALTGTATAAALTMSGLLLSTVASGGINQQINQSSGTIADNGTYDPPAGNYNLMWIYEATTTGQQCLISTDGFTVNIVWQSGTIYTNAVGTAGKINLYFTGGHLRIQNKCGANTTFYSFRVAGHQ